MADRNLSGTVNPVQTLSGSLYTVPGETGGSTSGKDGGYYTPSVTQPDENTMRVSYTPSDSSMPEVGSKDVTLPAGPAGADGAPGSDGAQGADGKSAYQYAQEGGYTGTEEEFAEKLAAEFPDKLPNPNALTFTGAVTGTYDGSTPLEVLIPSGGGGDDAGNELKLAWSLDVTQTLDSVSQEIVFSTPPKMIFIYGIGVENSTSSNVTARISISNNGNSISSENFNLDKFSGPSGTPNYSCAVILFFKNTYLFAYSNSTSSDFHSWNHKNQNVSYYSNPGQLVDWDKITIDLWNVTAGRIEIYSDSEVV